MLKKLALGTSCCMVFLMNSEASLADDSVKVGDYWYISKESSSDSESVSRRVVALCPDGSLLIGGGFSSSRPTAVFFENMPYANGDKEINSWRVAAVDIQSFGEMWTITAHATCQSKPTGP